MNLLQLIADINARILAAQGRANAHLAGLPPVEQVEGAQEFIAAKREFEYIKEELGWLAGQLEEINTNLPAQIAAMKEEGYTEILAAKIEEKEVIMFADSEAAVALARQAAADEAAQLAADADAAATLASERREAATEALGEAATHLSDEDLAADDHAVKTAAMGERVKAMATAGITADNEPLAKHFARLAAMPMDEDGHALFASTLEVIADTVKLASGGRVAPRLAGSPSMGGAGSPAQPAGNGPHSSVSVL